MDYSQLDYNLVSEKANALRDASRKMDELFKEIEGLFDRNIGEGGAAWSGDAATNTKAKFDQFRTKFPEFTKSIDDCCVYLTTKVLTGFQAVDKAVTTD